MKRTWTKEQISMLKKLYPHRTTPELVEVLHHSRQAISVKAHKLGLHKDPIHIVMNVGFKKGYTPFNKGMKMEEFLTPATHAKIVANQQKTADRNRAAAFKDGTIVNRKQGRYIKINGEWIPYRNYIYRQNVGVIPEGYTVFGRDGNKYNLSPENLYIGKINAPAEIIKTEREKSQIMRKAWVTRRRNSERKYAELDHVLEEIRKSNNDIYYKPQIF